MSIPILSLPLSFSFPVSVILILQTSIRLCKLTNRRYSRCRTRIHTSRHSDRSCSYLAIASRGGHLQIPKREVPFLRESYPSLIYIWSLARRLAFEARYGRGETAATRSSSPARIAVGTDQFRPSGRHYHRLSTATPDQPANKPATLPSPRKVTVEDLRKSRRS